MDVKVKENPFLRERISVVGPDIKHERATVMPVVKEVPQSKRPPEPIREIKVREIKEKRPLVRERESFRSQASITSEGNDSKGERR